MGRKAQISIVAVVSLRSSLACSPTSGIRAARTGSPRASRSAGSTSAASMPTNASAQIQTSLVDAAQQARHRQVRQRRVHPQPARERHQRRHRPDGRRGDGRISGGRAADQDVAGLTGGEVDVAITAEDHIRPATRSITSSPHRRRTSTSEAVDASVDPSGGKLEPVASQARPIKIDDGHASK